MPVSQIQETFARMPSTRGESVSLGMPKKNLLSREGSLCLDMKAQVMQEHGKAASLGVFR